MVKKDYSRLLSICIPSYNRGHRALDLVRSLLQMSCICQRDDIEIIVSNNGSAVHTDEYEIIRNIPDDRLVYNRFEENIQFYGNYNEIIKMSKGHWCLLISDEDSIDEDALSELIGLIEKAPDIGIIKARTSNQYKDLTSGSFRSGDEALKKFYLTGNYISGTIYNRNYVTDELIEGLKSLYEGDEGYYYYPHLFVEGYVLNKADFCGFGRILVTEGDDEGDMPKAQNVSVPVFASWESRIRQLDGYYKLIRDLNIDDDRKQLMFMMAVCKTIALIGLVKAKYLNTGADWDDIYVTAGNAILDGVRRSGISVIDANMEPYLQVVADFIRKDLR